MSGKITKQGQIRDAYENRIKVEYIPPKKQHDETKNDEKILRVAPYCRVSTDTRHRSKRIKNIFASTLIGCLFIYMPIQAFLELH